MLYLYSSRPRIRRRIMSLYVCSGNAKFDRVVEMMFVRSVCYPSAWPGFQHPLTDDPCLDHFITLAAAKWYLCNFLILSHSFSSQHSSIKKRLSPLPAFGDPFYYLTYYLASHHHMYSFLSRCSNFFFLSALLLFGTRWSRCTLYFAGSKVGVYIANF